jgi:beta-galactosidase
VPVETAVLFDWENRWAMEDSQGPLNDGRLEYDRTCRDHYYPLWSMGIAADIVDQDADFSRYRLVIAPMMYMVKKGAAERLIRFVEAGGTLVGTYWSGIVDDTDLCFLGGAPGPLRRLFGVRVEEIDALYAVERRAVETAIPGALGLGGRYEARDLLDLLHLEGAKALAFYGEDFYKGMPALTVNAVGSGFAYYMASRNDERFLKDFYTGLASKMGLARAVPGPVPEGVSARIRRDDAHVFLFLMNFTPVGQEVGIGGERWTDALSGEKAAALGRGRPGAGADKDVAAPAVVNLPPYGTRVFRRPA